MDSAPTDNVIVLLIILLMWLVLGLGGCPATTTPELGNVQPQALPNELEPVLANRNAFAADSGGALENVEPGTAIDPLSNLDGCWATYYTYTAEANDNSVPAGTPLVDAFEVYRFNAQSGQVEYQIYQEAVSGTLAIFAAYEGSYTVLDESRINVTWEQLSYSDPETGEIGTQDLSNQEEASGGELLVTLSGNELRLPGEAGGAEETSRVFYRYDCP